MIYKRTEETEHILKEVYQCIDDNGGIVKKEQLIALGIDRSAMGDILLFPFGAVVFVTPPIAAFLLVKPSPLKNFERGNAYEKNNPCATPFTYAFLNYGCIHSRSLRRRLQSATTSRA